jgi:hypothetical protein
MERLYWLCALFCIAASPAIASQCSSADECVSNHKRPTSAVPELKNPCDATADATYVLLLLLLPLHHLALCPAARGQWAREAAEVLLGVILAPSNSQRSRQAAVAGMGLLSQQLDVHVSVWLAPVLAAMSPPLMSRRIIPVRVRRRVLV